MTACRVCGSHMPKPHTRLRRRRSQRPWRSSIFRRSPSFAMNAGMRNPAICPISQAFYDTSYQISMESDDHDQIFAIGADDQPIYRTDHQAAVSLRLLDLPQGAAILDYGAAKSSDLAQDAQGKAGSAAARLRRRRRLQARLAGLGRTGRSGVLYDTGRMGWSPAAIMNCSSSNRAEPVFSQGLHDLLAPGDVFCCRCRMSPPIRRRHGGCRSPATPASIAETGLAGFSVGDRQRGFLAHSSSLPATAADSLFA